MGTLSQINSLVLRSLPNATYPTNIEKRQLQLGANIGTEKLGFIATLQTTIDCMFVWLILEAVKSCQHGKALGITFFVFWKLQ